jgi:tetratricopeptide (TPR) repeat protein
MKKNIRQKIENLINAKKYSAAVQLIDREIKIAPNNLESEMLKGVCIFASGNYKESSKYFHLLHEKYPTDLNICRFAGDSYLKIGEFLTCELFYKKIVANNPNDFECWMNLCVAAGSNAQHTDILFYSFQALKLRPSDPRCHNNIGTALLMAGRMNDALISFETAVQLKPDFTDPLSNIATILSMQGKTNEAIEAFEALLKTNPNDLTFQKTMKYRMSFDLFRKGQLTRGWEYYNYGFDVLDSRGRKPNRSFEVPEWNGTPLSDKQTLLIWREQGLGDEIMFLSALSEISHTCPNIIVECDPRLVPILSRTFPEVLFRAQEIGNDGKSKNTDFDFHISIGNAFGLIRSTIASFALEKPYWIPNQELSTKYSERLAALPGKYKVGIAWRSTKLNVERNTSYTSLSDWKEILALPNIDFINLQHGDCANELSNCEQEYGIKIHNWDDIDLMNDLESVFALTSNLDLVVTPCTAISEMAPSLGVPTMIMFLANTWVLFGTDKYLVHQDTKAYVTEVGEEVATLIPTIAKDIGYITQ